MRKILGPILLAALALVSLLFLQHQTRSDTGAAPSPSSSVTSTTPAPTSRSSLPSSSTSAPRPSTTSAPLPAGSDGEVEGTPVPPSATATPAGTAQAAQWATATDLAGRFLKAFARPAAGTTTDDWWATVQPYLSSQAAADYAGTDPANVPFTSVTGAGVVVPVDAPDSLVTMVQVPTDAGPYLVEIRSTPEGLTVIRATPQGRR